MAAKYYYDEILNGLNEIPCSGAPGKMVVTGIMSQAVFTNQNGDVFIAAAEYGDGRILAFCHDYYSTLLNDNISGLEEQFMNNVKAWLTKGQNFKENNILDIYKANDKTDFTNYKIIKWIGGAVLSNEIVEKLKLYVEFGGALICAITPWGFLSIHSNKKLEDVTMYHFLKETVGIILTNDYMGLPARIPISSNQAKYASFGKAVEKITKDATKIPKYCKTIDSCIDVLSKEGLVDCEAISNLKDSVLHQCSRNHWNSVPSEATPVKTDEEKNATKLLGKCYMQLGEKAPNINEFPGDFNELPELITNVQISLTTNFSEWLSTGYYLPAGVTMTLMVIQGDVINWKIRIGAHTDNLTNCDRYCRWPVISIVKDIESQLTICSPFGGLIYFESSKAGNLDVIISNVVESPYYDVKKPETAYDWDVNRLKPGLWAEIAGHHIILTCPSSCLRDLRDPSEVAEFWDEAVRLHHKCRGTTPNDYRRERIVCDKQASAGYMHSGYPIVTHLDICQKECSCNILDVNKLRTNGNWGVFHELGHNMQRSEWTFDGCGEVTVNIFTMHAMLYLSGQAILETEFVRDRKREFKDYFDQNPSYERWKSNCCLALMTFAQLIKHFGWEPMYRFMSDYEYDMKHNRGALPKSNQDKIDQWIIRYSKIINRNIKPQFELWGLPVSENVDAYVNGLDIFCPVDEVDSNVFFSKNFNINSVFTNFYRH